MERIDSAFKQFNVHGHGIMSFDLDKLLKGVVGSVEKASDDEDGGKSSKRARGSRDCENAKAKSKSKDKKEIEPDQVNAKATAENLSVDHGPFSNFMFEIFDRFGILSLLKAKSMANFLMVTGAAMEDAVKNGKKNQFLTKAIANNAEVTIKQLAKTREEVISKTM